jgi:hypothetical protein
VKDKPRYAYHRCRAHPVANDAIRLLADRIVGRQEVRRFVPDPVDAIGCNETLDIDGAGALEFDRFKLVVLEGDVVVLATRISPDLVRLIICPPVSASTYWLRIRLPVRRFNTWNRTFSSSPVAAVIATGQVTRLSFM